MQQNGDGYMDFYFIILRPLLFERPQKRKEEKPKCVYMETYSKERKYGWLHSVNLLGQIKWIRIQF